MQLKSDGLICVSVNPIISLFVILSSLTILSTCFDSDLTYEPKLWLYRLKQFIMIIIHIHIIIIIIITIIIITITTIIIIIIIMENKSSFLNGSNGSNPSLFTFIAIF